MVLVSNEWVIVRSNDLGSTGWRPSAVEILRFAQDDYPCRIVSFEWWVIVRSNGV